MGHCSNSTWIRWRYSGIPAGVLVVVFFWGTCCCGATSGDDQVVAAFKVANNLKHGAALTVLHPPGCCSRCGPYDPPPGVFCPSVCVQCPNVVVAKGKVVALDSHVGPYPLPFLQIQVKEKVYYCVGWSGLQLITASVTLAVGPGECAGPSKSSGLQAFVFVSEKPSPVAPLCLHLCTPHT